MKAIKFFLFVLLMIVFGESWSQLRVLDSLDRVKKEQYLANRKLYIEERDDQWYIKPILTVRFLNLAIEDEDKKVNEIVYSPSSNNFFGFGLYLFDLSAELSFKLPQNEDDRPSEVYGKTKSFDFQTNIYAKKWGADISFQRYNGMYVENPSSHYDDWMLGDAYPIRDDLTLRYFQANAFYLFNNEKFSYRSPYIQADRQLKSQGSFLLSFLVSSFRFEADTSLIPVKTQAAYPGNESLRKMRATTLAILPGYTYTLTAKGFYVNGSFSLGPGHLWTLYNRDDYEKEDIGFRPVVGLRGGFGYNGSKFFAGATTNLLIVSSKIDNMNVNSRSGNIKFFIGLRFEEKGVMKNRLFN